MTDALAPLKPVASGELLEKFEHYAFRVSELTEYDISFEVSKIDAECTDGSWFFWKIGAPSNFSTHDFADAERVLSGHIKWDGCSNWDFHQKENGLLHFCGFRDATSLSRLIGRLYEIAAERMPKFDRDCAGMPEE